MSTLSKLTGGDASAHAGQAQTLATQQQGVANAYGQQGAGVYGALNSAGANQSAAYQGNYLNLLNEYGSLAGLGANAVGGAPVNPATQGGAGVRTATAPGAAANQPGAQQGGAGQQVQGGNQASNPYSLDQNQQSLLNQQIAGVQQSAKQATAGFQQQMEAQGITDPRSLEVGTQQIQEHFAQLSSQTQTAFYQQVKTDKLQAMQQLLSGLSGYGQTGISQQEAAGSGYLGLASGAQAATNAQQSNALNQQNLSNEQLSGLFQLIGGAVGGGLGGGLGAASSSGTIFDASGGTLGQVA